MPALRQQLQAGIDAALARTFPALMVSKSGPWLVVLTRFLHANRCPTSLENALNFHERRDKADVDHTVCSRRSGWNFHNAITPRTTKVSNTTPCVMTNGGSACFGARC